MSGTAPKLHVVDDQRQSLSVSTGDVTLFRYVYRPTHPQLESPRPYFHPLRTRAGHLVSTYRPWDHVWHKGITWSLPNVGPHNFWGGPTYVRDRGYVQADNNGSTVHRGFSAVEADEDRMRVEETLDWVMQGGTTLFTETRVLRARLADQPDRWTLGFATEFTNVSGETVPIGSPTTEGRPNAGYGGFFWRGPRSFTNGRAYMSGRVGGDDLMGERGAWLAYAGKHDEVDASSTLVFVDENASTTNEHERWFVRTGAFAAVCPAPFFDTVRMVEPGDSLSLAYSVTVVDADTGPDGAREVAERRKS